MVLPSCQHRGRRGRRAGGVPGPVDDVEARREQLPFGFNPSGRRRRSSGNRPVPAAAADPFSALRCGGARQDIGAAFQRLGQLLSWQGGPVNWDLARDVARQAVAAAVTGRSAGAERMEVADAMRLAELWLDEATAPARPARRRPGLEPRRVGRGDAAGLEGLVDPVAAKAVESMGAMLSGDSGPMAQLGAMPEQLQAARRGRPAAADDGQHRRGHVRQPDRPGPRLAGDGGGRLDRRRAAALTRPATAALLPAERHGVRRGARTCPPTRCGSTWRCARRPTSGCSPTCRGCAPTSSTRSSAYARGISIDTSRLEEAVGRASTRPTRRPCRRRSPAGCSSPRTPRSRRPHWPGSRPRSPWSRAGSTRWSTPPRRRTCRRPARCARPSGAGAPAAGPAEATFASLVGLELRPRRLREAAALWNARRRRPRHRRPRRRLGPPRPAADRRRPRLPRRLRQRWLRRRWTCPGLDDTEAPMTRSGKGTTDDAQAAASHRPRERAARRRGASAARLTARRRTTRSSCGRRTSSSWRAHPDGMARDCVPAHLTASAMVLDAAGDRGAVDAAPQGRFLGAGRRPLRARGRDARRRRAA